MDVEDIFRDNYTIIYRPHRGDLKSSMSRTLEFKTVEEMKNHISKHQYYGSIKASDIIVKDDTIDDKRISWRDTREVYAEMDNTQTCIGYCATDYY